VVKETYDCMYCHELYTDENERDQCQEYHREFEG